VLEAYERARAKAVEVQDVQLQLTVTENLDYVLRKHGRLDHAAALAPDLERLRALQVRSLDKPECKGESVRSV